MSQPCVTVRDCKHNRHKPIDAHYGPGQVRSISGTR